MLEHDTKAQSEKFAFISSQHGGYHRHNFLDLC
jgi:hypothetical protein